MQIIVIGLWLLASSYAVILKRHMQGIIQDKKIFHTCFEKMKKHAWTCMAPNCTEKSINSHVLQKNGILSQIAFNQHIIEVKPLSIWEMDELSVFKYQEIGVNDGFSFPGFCSFHDSEIFKDIESNTVDLDSYRTQCLFSYRGLCQEIKRKEQVELFLNDLLGIREKFSVIDVGQIFEDYKYGLSLGIRNLTFFKNLEVCTSAPINIQEPNEKAPESMEEYDNLYNVQNKKLPTTFVNIFPTATDSIWIVGEHKEYRSSYTSRLINTDYEEALSELFILRMEYWCMSHSFFYKNINPKMAEIKKACFRTNVALTEFNFWEKWHNIRFFRSYIVELTKFQKSQN